MSLDGSGREFIRTGTELVCYLPDQRTVLVEKRADERPAARQLPAFDEAPTAFYDIKELKRTRIYRRDTRVIAVKPKDEFRYGYRLWIDEETAMPLKTQLCDARGRVIEQIVFAEPGAAHQREHPRFRLQAGGLDRGLPVAAHRSPAPRQVPRAERRAVECARSCRPASA